KGMHLWSWIWMWRPGHIHMMLSGWTVQFACGVAIWILPRLDAAGSRGALWSAWLFCAAINGGVALATLYAPLTSIVDHLEWMLPLAAFLYIIAAFTFVHHAWRRVRPFGAITTRSMS
ncbi:MAG: hypothetical protein ACUVWS_07605, partial [Roseiflexus sp.]